MNTNYKQIKELLIETLSFLESVEANGGVESFRSRNLNIDDRNVSGFDVLQSAIHYPENLSKTVVRARHDLDVSKHYESELEKILINTSKLCTELFYLDKGDEKVKGVDPHNPNGEESINDKIRKYKDWLLKCAVK